MYHIEIIIIEVLRENENYSALAKPVWIDIQ